MKWLKLDGITVCTTLIVVWKVCVHWSHWQRGSAAVCFLGLRVRIPPGAWMSVCCECCVMSGRGLCVGLVTRTEESYRGWCVSNVCDREVSIMRPWPTRGCCGNGKEITLLFLNEFGGLWLNSDHPKTTQLRWLSASRNVVLNAYSSVKFKPFLALVLRKIIWMIQCKVVEIAQSSDNAMGLTTKESLFDLR
jgi:hypothetical protein